MRNTAAVFGLGFHLLDVPTRPVRFLQEFTRWAKPRLRFVEEKMMFDGHILSFGDENLSFGERTACCGILNNDHMPKS